MEKVSTLEEPPVEAAPPLSSKEKRRASQKRWADANPEKIREKARRKYARRGDELREKQRQYYNANKDAIMDRRRSSEEQKAKARERSRLWYAENRERAKERSRAYRAANLEACRERSREQRRRKPDLVRNAQLKRDYGIDMEGYRALLQKQGGCCAICGTDRCTTGHKLSVDHCHETGKVRGLLCKACNNGIGHFSDDTARLYRAIAYLEERTHERH